MTVALPTTEIGYVRPETGRFGLSSNWWALLEAEEPVPELRWPESIVVYDRMRRDAQVASLLRAVTYPVLYTPWRIDPAGAREQVARQVADDFGLPLVGAEPSASPRARDRFSWPDHLRHALLSLPYGCMFFEQVYRPDDARQARLRKLGPRMPRSIAEINVARDGGLASIRQHPEGWSVRADPIPVDRLVAYVHDREGGNWAGTSLLRPAYPHWQIKRRLMPVQAATIERNGMGVPRYTGPEAPEDAKADLAAGLKMATAWRSGDSAGASIPYGAKLDLVGVSGTLPDAMAAIRYHDEQMARAVLAHFLNLGSQGGGQVGSYALGSTFADFFTQSLQAIAQWAADIVNAHVIEDLIDINYGPTEPAPRLTFDAIGSRQAATAVAIKALIDAGALFPDRALEESLRQLFGLPPKPTPQGGA